MRLIDADRTKESIPETSVDIFENCARCGLLDREQVFDLIDEQPTIDAVPVVRCKECRFSVVNENIGRKPLICGKTKMCGETTPDWFCAAGERSEE